MLDLNYTEPTILPAEIDLAFDNTVNTGSFLLLQRVITLLFKDKETALIPEMGTDIIQLITGNVTQASDLQNQFIIAADVVRENIQSSVTSTTPENEQLDSIDVTASVSSVDPSAVSVDVTITTVSGDAVSSTIPYNLRGA